MRRTTITFKVRKGGKNPIVPTTWQEEITATVLEIISDGRNRTENLHLEIAKYLDFGRLQKTYGHTPAREEVEGTVAEMLSQKLISVGEYVCTCCELRTLSGRETLRHAKTLQLTKIGRNRVPPLVIKQPFIRARIASMVSLPKAGATETSSPKTEIRPDALPKQASKEHPAPWKIENAGGHFCVMAANGAIVANVYAWNQRDDNVLEGIIAEINGGRLLPAAPAPLRAAMGPLSAYSD